jgi:hypothetical protein
MRALRSRTSAAMVVSVLLVGLVGWPPPDASAAAPSRPSPAAQCHVESASGSVRMWWDEDRSRNVLAGEDGGVATDGRCSTVPASVPWMATQVETLMRDFAAMGLPLPKSDQGIQKIDRRLSDDGSAAYDVYLDGQSDRYSLATAQCVGVEYYQAGQWKYRTLAKMRVQGVPATVPDADSGARFRQVLAHELAHSTQCAVTNPRRKINGSSLSGPWIEAVPQAIAMGLVGGSWDVGICGQDTRLLSSQGRDIDKGYGQWPFWQALLGGPSHSRYPALLREVISVPLAKAGPQLDRVLRARFTDAQISRALLAWASARYFGGTLPSASGNPITLPASSLLDSFGYLVDEATGSETPQFTDPLMGEISPPPGGTATMAVTIAPLTCAALLVPWPSGAQTVTVGATGPPGGELGNVMAAGLDVAPGTPATARCGTDGPRTIVPLTGNQFAATRPCDGRSLAPRMWVLMANGGTSPLKLTVSATAS